MSSVDIVPEKEISNSELKDTTISYRMHQITFIYRRLTSTNLTWPYLYHEDVEQFDPLDRQTFEQLLWQKINQLKCSDD
jgi:hypothetical protein